MLLTQEETSNWSFVKVPQIRCNSGNRISEICVNKNCLFQAFKCCQDECQSCQPSNHQDCSIKKFTQLAKKVQFETSFKVKMIASIFELQEKFINHLRQSRKILGEKDTKSVQTIIESIFQKKSIQGLTGAKMSQLFSELSSPKKAQQKIERQFNKFKNEGEKMVKELANLRQVLFDYLTKKQETTDSTLLSIDQESYLLQQLNNPTQLKLLFRASQHNFLADKFHEFCDGINNTVTIVRTEFGKTIAGYTSLKWSSPSKSLWVYDYSQSSFLLQLELKEKMTLIQPQNAICSQKKSGPIFGGGADLCIVDKCNQKNSWCNFPFSYNCNKKYENNQQSYTAFCGSLQLFYFKVLDYQVFAVIK